MPFVRSLAAYPWEIDRTEFLWMVNCVEDVMGKKFFRKDVLY